VKKGLSEIICIIDKSGSMSSIKSDAIGGFNTFLKEQQALKGEATLTLVQFDTSYEIVYENEPIQNVKPITEETYRPRGMTALLDAVAKTIDNVGRRLSNTPEKNRPEKVIVSILTDGEENSSRKFNLKDVKDRISTQKNIYKWEFIYLGANQDAFAEATKLGIASIDTIQFDADAIGIRKAYNDMSQTTLSYRA